MYREPVRYSSTYLPTEDELYYGNRTRISTLATPLATNTLPAYGGVIGAGQTIHSSYPISSTVNGGVIEIGPTIRNTLSSNSQTYSTYEGYRASNPSYKGVVRDEYLIEPYTPTRVVIGGSTTTTTKPISEPVYDNYSRISTSGYTTSGAIRYSENDITYSSLPTTSNAVYVEPGTSSISSLPGYTGPSTTYFGGESNDELRRRVALLESRVNQLEQIISGHSNISLPANPNSQHAISGIPSTYVNPQPLRVIVGPVIGVVDHRSARILFEMSDDCEATCLLVDNRGFELAKTIYLRRSIPAIFHFNGLQPDTKYRVFLSGFDHVKSSFTTFSVVPQIRQKLNFAVLSCNKIRNILEEGTQANDVWESLANRVEAGDINMLLHLGDQVYGDDDWSNYEDGKVKYEDMVKHCMFAQATELLKGKRPEEYESYREQITELYRDVYRRTWSHGPTRRVLANCPSIMMYDDHEIRDDLGDKKAEFEVGSSVHFIAHCGRRVCFEYQRQLFQDFDLSHPLIMPKVRCENHIIHSMGEYGILMVDTRGAKTFNKVANDPKPFVTSAQWDDIKFALSPSGPFANVKLLIFATQIPLVFFPPSITDSIAKHADDFEGMWSYKQNAVEQTEMLNLLKSWKQANPSRQVYLLGGDVHLAGHTQVYHNNEFLFRQMIVGPSANSVLNKIQFAIVRLVKEASESLNDGWSFEHYGWAANNNVGLVYTEPSDDGKSIKIRASHLITDKTKVEEVCPQPPKEKKSSWSLW